MSTDAVRLALVGGGRMGRTHLDALASSEAVEVTAAMDPVPGARQALAAEAARAARDAGVLLQVGYWRRFVPELVALRARIAAGELGEISLVRSWQWDGSPPHREFRVRSGGIIVDMGGHELDQTPWVTGQGFG